MENYDTIIIGGGASGLMAALQLGSGGKRVLLLEANESLGGRIRQETGNGFAEPMDMGAEFVHGQLPETLDLLDAAGITYSLMQGQAMTVYNGEQAFEERTMADWPRLMEKLQSLETDMTIAAFLETYFGSEKDAALRKEVSGFVEGFDAADPKSVSAFSLRKEWANEDDEHQYFIKGGYTPMINWMAKTCGEYGVVIKTAHPVTKVQWETSKVSVYGTNFHYTAKTLLYTGSLGVWQKQPEENGYLFFDPILPTKTSAALQMGFGNVVKIKVAFNEPVWQTKTPMAGKDLNFIFSDAEIPTWWINPYEKNVLTGWKAGPGTAVYRSIDQEDFTAKIIDLLAYIFNTSKAEMQALIAGCLADDWSKETYTGGCYSFETLASTKARSVLKAPVAMTLFFAGEALYEGNHTGTVEAALVSGKEAAGEILRHLNK